MTQDTLAAAMAAAAPLQDTIRPLRAQRRAIPKGGAREAERRALLREELVLEQAELEALEAQWREPGGPLNERVLIEEHAAANLHFYISICVATPPLEALQGLGPGLGHMARSAADVHLSPSCPP